MNISNYLSNLNVESDIIEVLSSFQNIATKVWTALIFNSSNKTDHQNASWDNQASLDIISDKIFLDELSCYKCIASLISEEQEEVVKLSDSGKYSLAYDPIDWSSLLDVNLSVGSIFCIFKGQSIIWQKAGDMICAWSITYWPRISLLIAIKWILSEFTLRNNEFILTKENIKINEETKIFSPWNLKVCSENSKYKALVDSWITKWLTLRYSGWMVPDMNAIFLKWQGIFTYPKEAKYPNWRLRLNYETWPFSYMAQTAWWIWLCEDWTNILNLEITQIHQRSTIFVGSKNEVLRCIKFLA